MSDLVSEARTKILIAEDDAIVALDLQGMVARLGYDVVAIVDNGHAAVAAANRFLPDIILLDMQLSGAIDGIEVARKIHETSSIPVIFCISSPDLSALFRAKDISYAGYLLKPINPDSLATTLDTVLYKFKLEKRAEIAEERYRKLAETCEVLNFFRDEGIAYRWTLSESGSVALDDVSGTDSIDGSLVSQIENLVASARGGSGSSEDNGIPFRVAGVIRGTSVSGDECLYAVIGARGNETSAVSGLAIRLDSANR